MVFSSVIFLFAFLPLTLLVYFVLPMRLRNVFLLLASLLFYAWGETNYTLVILASIVVNYVVGILIERAADRRGRKRAVAIGVAINLGMLIFFKYANFIMDNVNAVLVAAGATALPNPRIHLPLGISFFTFQAISYIVDVYRGHVKAQGNFINYALYKALFPQLIAGPIVRYIDVSRQIVSRVVTPSDFAAGVRIFLVGLGKKVLIANIVAAQVDRIFAIPHDQLPTSIAWIGIVCFALQLYFDFSGYSDMAIGLGRMFGFHFLANFNYPYISRTLTEFWQRWHISLSTWFRDYLFTPLGGYRCSRPRAYLNLMTVFFLCGLWHGASWNFVLFGVYQGMFLIFERLVRAKRIKLLNTPVGNAYLLFIIFTTMVFFRTETLAHAWAYYKAMFGFVPPNAGVYLPMAYLAPETILAGIAGIVGSTPVIPWLAGKMKPDDGEPAGGMELFRQAACFVGLAAILLLCSMKLAAGTHNPFIYFRF
jgi:alginate O-acetyltransferase complex protein AlgI